MQLREEIHILGAVYKMDFSQVTMGDFIDILDETGKNNGEIFLATARLMQKVIGKDNYRKLPMTHAAMVHSRIISEMVCCFTPDVHLEDKDAQKNSS